MGGYSVLKLPIASEHAEQVGFVHWFRARFPRVLIFAIPNGGKRAANTARQLKAEGVVRGVPDLFVPEWRLWVEMKRAKGGSLSPDQRGMIAYLDAIGHHVIVGKGAADASKQVLEWLKKREN